MSGELKDDTVIGILGRPDVGIGDKLYPCDLIVPVCEWLRIGKQATELDIDDFLHERGCKENAPAGVKCAICEAYAAGLAAGKQQFQNEAAANIIERLTTVKGTARIGKPTGWKVEIKEYGIKYSSWWEFCFSFNNRTIIDGSKRSFNSRNEVEECLAPLISALNAEVVVVPLEEKQS